MALGKLGYHEVTQATVNFAFNSDELDQKSGAILDDLAQQIANRPELLIDVYGFTDRTGPDQYNFGLGLRRAQAVERYLVDKTPGQLVRYAAISYGKTKPVGDQSTKESRADNRRVVVSLIERVPPTGGSAERSAGMP
jgi:outer membrane protein OmpA-like peptidoglycan-associated protein